MVSALTALAQSVAAEWAVFDFAGLQFWRRDTGRLALIAVAGISVLLLLIRAAVARKPGRHQVILPALLRSVPGSRLAWSSLRCPRRCSRLPTRFHRWWSRTLPIPAVASA